MGFLVLFSTIRLFFPPFNDDLGTMPTRRPYSWKKKAKYHRRAEDHRKTSLPSEYPSIGGFHPCLASRCALLQAARTFEQGASEEKTTHGEGHGYLKRWATLLVQAARRAVGRCQRSKRGEDSPDLRKHKVGSPTSFRHSVVRSCVRPPRQTGIPGANSGAFCKLCVED